MLFRNDSEVAGEKIDKTNQGFSFSFNFRKVTIGKEDNKIKCSMMNTVRFYIFKISSIGACERGTEGLLHLPGFTNLIN